MLNYGKFNFEWIEGTKDFSPCLDLRMKVFVDEQKFQNELDKIDPKAKHLLLKLQDEAVGTARVFTENENWVIGRICVNKNHRGDGIGSLILELCERQIALEGGITAVLHAQTGARGFYEKSGYSVCGEEYFEEYCKHIPMKKIIWRDKL